MYFLPSGTGGFSLTSSKHTTLSLVDAGLNRIHSGKSPGHYSVVSEIHRAPVLPRQTYQPTCTWVMDARIQCLAYFLVVSANFYCKEVDVYLICS